MRIRSRLAPLLIVPLVGLLGVTAFQVTNAVQQSREATDLKSGAELGLASFQLIDALQAERQLLAADQPVTPETRAAVDAASAEVRSRAAVEGGALEAMATRALSRMALSLSAAVACASRRSRSSRATRAPRAQSRIG